MFLQKPSLACRTVFHFLAGQRGFRTTPVTDVSLDQMWDQHPLPLGSPWTKVLSASRAQWHKSWIFCELGITAKSCAFY